MSCKCNLGLSNTGNPNCLPIQSVTSSLILVPLYSNAGVRNGISLADAVLPATYTALINQADASLRWYPIPAMENIEQPKADSLFEEAASGKKAFLRQGTRSFSGEIWEGASPQLYGKLKDNRCVEFGFYVRDVDGNLIGSNEGTGVLYPIPVDNASWNPTIAFATDSTIQKIMIGFDWNRLFDESTLWMVTSDEAGLNFNSLEGLLDVNLVGTDDSLTSTDVSGTLDYGTFVNAIKFSGATSTADWSIYNVTDSASVTVTSVTESPAGSGIYAIGHATGIASADVYTISVSKDGFIGTSNEITAP